ncbi:glycoside hydrolase family 47 protein [Lepidopterella palustris CBS 459.81]|uniref:alpha-1,2-Mannosidase n=1 Tax=Lepidopterella palustris CBS 459.81 TaxID=1314670 RepID=A0A8E2E971_9PEZI|nr:glycoside hydrolase family 47 protein [Lepidopterella palustris CBS 459.81]
MGWFRLAFLTVLLPVTLAVPISGSEPPKVSYGNTTGEAYRANAVKQAFQFSWNGYKTYAFPHDELHPNSYSYSDSRNGWGASAVDALSTAIIMELSDVVNEIIDYIPSINFAVTATEVSLFETTIRYLGGMLAGYDFLKVGGPLSNLAANPANVDALLRQAECLANALSYAFDTPTGIPYNGLHFTTRSVDGGVNGLATAGTLVLEWTHLSDLTGNQTYAQLSQKAQSYLLHPQPPSSEPFPGLLGTNINVTTGLFQDSRGGWVGGDDSFYEYLIKMFVYDASRFTEYRDRWIAAADSTMTYLTSHPSTRPDLTFVAMFNNKTPILTSQHLACFDGGNFLLGGQVLDRQDYIKYGLALVDGCHDTYTSTATGIGPESFSWDPNLVPEDQTAFFQAHGFFITNSIYDLRPEVLESYYYAYRITGDTKYQDWAWDAFVAINATTRAPSGYTEVSDVNKSGGGKDLDFQESFWFAEVLKYAYLIHAPEAEWQVQAGRGNKWVFNTEAHPFRVAGSPI